MLDKILFTTEVASAVLMNNLDDNSRKEFIKSPSEFIYSVINIDFSQSVDMAVVKNTDTVMNLALPYYETLNKIDARPLESDDLENVIGGEIFITLGILIGGIAGGVAAAAISTGATAGLGVGFAVGIAVGATIGGTVGAGIVTSVAVGAAHGAGHDVTAHK